MQKLNQLAFEAVLILVSVAITSQLHLKINLIPRFIFRYQQGFYEFEEITTLAIVYVCVGALILYISKLIKFGPVFHSEKYFARELFLIALSSSISSLVIFIFTKVFFDPNFVAVQLLVIIITYILLLFCFGVRTKLPNIGNVLREGIKYAFSIKGVLVIAICLSPVPMAVYFKKNKDFANTINQIRNLSDGLGLKWQFVRLYSQVPLSQPILVRQHPGAPETFFVLERGGKLITLNSGGDRTVLLDFSSRVGIVQVENGAVGYALHPEFGSQSSPKKGYAYFHYTDVTADRQINRLSRFDVSLPTQKERLKSELVLIEQPRNRSGFHNGGSVEFGPDGFLYLGVGDANDNDNLQTVSKGLFSGIFRIDVNSVGGKISHPISRQPKSGFTANYMIPNNNPFVGRPESLEEFWALGLRNPFRFSFDPETQKLWVGDVGAEQIEEVDIVTRGGNYQFPYFEGGRRTERAIPEKIIGIESPPYFAYRHKANERAVIGGVVYRGDKHMDLKGKYIFADNAAGQLYSIDADKSGQMEKRALAKTDQFGYVGIASVVESLSGDILVTTLGSKTNPTGNILKLEMRESSLLSDIIELVGGLFGHSEDGAHVHGEGFSAMQSQESYIENCSRCHGVDGRGSKELESELARIIPDFSDPKFQSSRSDEELREVILKGGAGIGKSEAMPPWEGVLDEEQTKSMVKLLRGFERAKK
ncbi:MAG: hypothetical protein HOJ06_20080 [Rhodospirillaceae bacterium]|nr:hypothetical protein [Rhodospirillaceae bacterium]